KPPTSRSPPSPCPTGQQTKISDLGSTASASNTIGLCDRNQHARLCYQRRCYCRLHNTAVHIMTKDVGGDLLLAQGGAGRRGGGGVPGDAPFQRVPAQRGAAAGHEE